MNERTNTQLSPGEKALSLLLDGGTAVMLLAVGHWVVKYF